MHANARRWSGLHHWRPATRLISRCGLPKFISRKSDWPATDDAPRRFTRPVLICVHPRASAYICVKTYFLAMLSANGCQSVDGPTRIRLGGRAAKRQRPGKLSRLLTRKPPAELAEDTSLFLYRLDVQFRHAVVVSRQIVLPRTSAGHRIAGRNRHHIAARGGASLWGCSLYVALGRRCQLAVRGRIMIAGLISAGDAWTEPSTKSASYRHLDENWPRDAVISRVGSTYPSAANQFRHSCVRKWRRMATNRRTTRDIWESPAAHSDSTRSGTALARISHTIAG